MDKTIESILRKRAERYAPAPEEKKEDPSIGTFVGCKIADVQLGLPSTIVVECASLQQWTPFSGRKHLLGITHLRGDVMSLIDLLEAVAGKPSGSCSNMVVLQASSGRFAVPVAEVLGMRNVNQKEMITSEQMPVVSPLILGATNDLWFLLNEKKLLDVMSSLSAR